MKIDGSGQLKTPRGVCSRAHGKRAGPSGYKLSLAQASFWPVFGTSTLPTDASVASARSYCELVYRIVALLGFVKFTWYEPLLIIK